MSVPKISIYLTLNGTVRQSAKAKADFTMMFQDSKNPKAKVSLEKMKKTYCTDRGWDKNGIPTEATLHRLKIK